MGGADGTVGTGSSNVVVSVILLPSAKVCVTVTGDGDMLKPGVLVLIVLDSLGLLLATAKEVVSTIVGPVGVAFAALKAVVDVLNGAGGVKSDGSGIVLSLALLVLVFAGVVSKRGVKTN